MKKDTKLGVNLMNKNVIKEMIKEVIDQEVLIGVIVTDDLGKKCETYFVCNVLNIVFLYIYIC